MYLHKLKINGFKRLVDIEIELNDATFLIGQNNSGKSSLLKAIDYLLSGKQIPSDEFHSKKDSESGICEVACEEIEMIAEFRNVSAESKDWRGFKGRTFKYVTDENSNDTGINIIYKKIWTQGKNPTQYLKSYVRKRKSEYENISNIEDLISAGIDSSIVLQAFDQVTGKITKKNEIHLDLIDEIWDLTENEEFFMNPGGIAGHVLSKLPRYLLIPADSGEKELSDKNGTLQKTLKELFKDVRDSSHFYAQAQTHLNNLASEMDPTDVNSDFGKLLKNLNHVMSTVFPESSVHVEANLSNPDDVLVPQFNIELESNVRTSVANQGTGIIRSAVFSLLRFRKIWDENRENHNKRSLIIGFEEPEIFLHPSAANQMRSTIYDLVGPSSQIIASTHSPYMIDLSRKPKQNLIRFTKNSQDTEITNFSVSEAFKNLHTNDQSYVKMLLKLDDYVSRAFFSERVILVEGDTEDIIIRETTNRLPEEKQNKVRASCEIIKGRGKPVLISLIKYLKALGITPIVMHDSDIGVPNAEKHNGPIKASLSCDQNLIVLNNCIEDILNYPPSQNNKPYKAFCETLTWSEDYNSIPLSWRTIYEKLVGI